MSDQKGSLKDRLRSWFLFLKYKIKLKKKKKEQKQKIKEQKRLVQITASGKYYSKPKVFGLTILGLFFGLFESKEKKTNKSVEQRIELLEQKIENNILDDNIIQEIENIENDIKIEKSNKKNKVEVIKKYEQKLNNIKTKLSNEIKQNENKKFNESKEKNKDDKKVKIVNNEVEVNKKQGKNVFNKKEVYIPVLEVKMFNKDLKKYNKDLKEINNKIKRVDDYNNLYEYEFLVKQLRLRLNDLLNKYDSLKNLPGFSVLEDMIKVKDIDEFDFRKDNKKIKESIKWCEETLINIEDKKQEILNKSNVKNTSKVLEKKEEVKKEVKKEKKIEDKNKHKISELLLADKIIYDNIMKEKRKIARFNKMVSTMNVRQKRHSIFYYTKNLISSVVNFGLSLFPISLFKNKILGGLVSGIMINNSLRSVRKILKPDIEISYIYANIEKEIISASSYLNKMSIICDDSLNQINEIRNTLYLTYGNDITYNQSLSSYLDDLSKIESKLKYEQATILGMNQDLNIIKEKNKQKVKKIQGYYN